MAIRNFAKYLWAAVLAASCQVQEPQNAQAPDNTGPVVSDVIPGKATVEFSEEMTALIEEGLQDGGLQTKSAALNSVMADLGIASMERVFPDAGEYEALHRRSGLHRFYRVTYSTNTPATKAVADLSSVPGVVSVTPAHRISLRSVSFNDGSYFSKQWHYIGTAGADINVEKVWEQYTTGSSNVIVSVVDEPVDPTHPDLKDNLWQDAQGHTGYNFARSSWDLSIRPAGGRYYGEWVNGDSGHGTHVAGTIGAVNNNGKGVCGIAGGDYANGIPGVRIMSCAIMSGYDGWADDVQIANAFTWAADHGAVISNNSWGPPKNVNESIETYDPCCKAAIDHFIKFAGCDSQEGNQRADSPMKGGLVFFAAGNSKYNHDPYGEYEPVIAVGATGPTGEGSSYSNYGSWVDIAAPGGEGYKSDDSIWSTLPQKVNDGEDGGGTVVTTSYYGGAGWAGTSMACPHASGVAALIVSYFGGEGFTADDAKAILYGGLGKTISVKNYSSRKVGKKLDALASFEWAFANGYTGGTTPGPGPEPPENKAPVITLSPSSITLKAHESAVISVECSDPDGDPIEITLQSPGSDAVTYDDATRTLRISAMKAPAGQYKAVMKVTDQPSSSEAQAKEATAELSYTILPNHAPTVVRGVEDYSQYGFDNITINNAICFTDQDGETLHYGVKVEDGTVATAEISGDKTIIYPKAYGTTTVTISALDGLEASASVSFRIAIVDARQPASLENNVVTGELTLNIGSPDPVSGEVIVYNSAGAQVLRQIFSGANAFYPVALDVSSLAPGRYTAIVKYDGKSTTLKFAKY
ncbi:MAG: S8 family serine peptidase [Bacteroidales bacterium]|nr:S8 family serine peptidase [Bacteroidales bacterium]